jgi:glycine/D-amino acid oxidase-like deaminating enzyme
VYDLVVIGGGVWGVSAARAATDANASVILLESRLGVGSEASAKAGGIVTDLLWHPEDQAWVEESRQLYAAASEHSQDATMLQRLGMVTLADPSRHHLLEARAQGLEARGIPATLLGHDDLTRQFPDLSVTSPDILALWLPNDWHVNPTQYCQVVADEARARGLTLRTGYHVSGLRIEDSAVVVEGPGESVRARRALLAAGAWTRRLVATAGYDLPLRPYRVQLASLAIEPGHHFPMVWDLATDIYIVPDGPRAMLAGDGTRLWEHDPDTYEQNGDPDFHEGLAEHVPALVAAGEGAHIVSSWAGAVGATPDRRPLLGFLDERLAVACGDNGFGVMRGPAIGRLSGLMALGLEGPRPHLDPKRLPTDDFEIRPGFTLED